MFCSGETAVTVQLPESNPHFPTMEQRVLQFWQESRAFDTLRDLRKDSPVFRFVDGPITANNPMGVHHAWGRTLKDVVLRYKAMTGHSAKYQNGFDCQGLWLEVEVEKSLGFQGKDSIEQYGLDKFSDACLARVNQFAQVITEQSVRLGQWMDWENSYFTHTDTNIRAIWHFLEKCHERKLIYTRGLPMPWCPRCSTSISEHEMAGSFRDLTHTSVYIKGALKDGRQLLFWTTTPWTLCANVAAAVNPELTYCDVTLPGSSEVLVLGEQALPKLKAKANILRKYPGSELVGLEFQTFFHDVPRQADIPHRVLPWKDVAAEEGTGIVHIAPGCGREDYDLGQEHGIPAIVPIDAHGEIGEGFGRLSGQDASTVAPLVIEELTARGRLFRAEPHEHSYPVCWRCKHELLFRLVDEWFINCQELRPQLIEATRTVRWTPSYMGKRMEDWLNNMGDWCISRKRYWGLPLPFYPCQECDHLNVVGSVDELRKLAVQPELIDALPSLHRPWIDDIEIRCEKCSVPVRRVKEVGDCWLDAGIVPYSTLGYFEDRADWERRFPAEWVCEMREQVRLWFYSMLVMGVTISGRAPYDSVLAYERVVSEDGAMFSKTGFMIRFDEAVEKMGADPLRYLYCQQPVASELRFGYAAGEACRRKLDDLWNIYTFYCTYAAIDNPDVSAAPSADCLHVTDRWLLARTEQMLSKTTAAYEGYDTPSVIDEVEKYLDDVSSWYVRINRRRFWKEGGSTDKQACYAALFHSIKTVVTVLAPITPFVTETIWQNLIRGLDPHAPASVHHATWPTAHPAWQDEALLERTAKVREVTSLALNLRNQSGLRVRQPLLSLLVVGSDADRAAVAEQAAIIQSELNVKSIDLLESADSLTQPRLILMRKNAGAVLRGDVPKVSKLLEQIPADVMAALVAQQAAGQPVELPEYPGQLPADIFLTEQVAKPHLKVTTAGTLTVGLDTTVTDELRREGLARDLVRNLQVLRKDAGFEVSQRIELWLVTDHADLQQMLSEHGSTVQGEVLATALHTSAIPGDVTKSTTVELEGGTITAAVRPVIA